VDVRLRVVATCATLHVAAATAGGAAVGGCLARALPTAQETAGVVRAAGGAVAGAAAPPLATPALPTASAETYAAAATARA
jgi:hypothetical protein